MKFLYLIQLITNVPHYLRSKGSLERKRLHLRSRHHHIKLRLGIENLEQVAEETWDFLRTSKNPEGLEGLQREDLQQTFSSIYFFKYIFVLNCRIFLNICPTCKTIVNEFKLTGLRIAAQSNGGTLWSPFIIFGGRSECLLVNVAFTTIHAPR